MSLEVLDPPVRDATTEGLLLFLEPSDRKPRMRYGYDSQATDLSEIYTPRRVLIRDARRIAASLDVQGFAWVHRPSTIDFRVETEIAGAGRTEAAELVRDVTGAARVVVFDHTLRKRAPDAARQPSTRVHVDYTADSAPRRVRDLLGNEAEALLHRRVAFINVWRAIRHPASDWPLALADARSVATADLVATDIVYPDRRGEIYGLSHNPQQRWFYYPDLALDEAIMIKCYDSRTDVARFTPHTAFESQLTRFGVPPRESIEFRTIAFFD
ncbi:MAG: CmcJ/NvfI family oxidoreductase [Hyphomonadaceae bacterium]